MLVGAAATKGTRDMDRIIKRGFGSRKVFVVYMICLGFIVATALGSIVSTLIVGSTATGKMVEHLALCVVAVAFVHIPVFVRAKFNWDISSFLHITATVFVIAHFILGEVFRVYDYSTMFDKILHATSGVVIATCGFALIYWFAGAKSKNVQLSPLFVAIFAFCFSMTVAVLWEFFEYFMDSAFKMNMQRWKDDPMNSSGLHDTMQDLLVACLGTIVVCIFGWLWLRKHPESKIFEIRRVKKEDRVQEKGKGKEAVEAEVMVPEQEKEKEKEKEEVEGVVTGKDMTTGTKKRR